MFDTPEAVAIPRENPLCRNLTLPPWVAIGGAAAALEVYNESTEPKAEKIFLQNLSITPVKYAFGQACSEGSFHGILAAGVAEDDGLGGNTLLDVKARGITSISLYCGGAAIRVSVEKHLNYPVVNQFI
jgi:hypothetical protein